MFKYFTVNLFAVFMILAFNLNAANNKTPASGKGKNTAANAVSSDKLLDDIIAKDSVKDNQKNDVKKLQQDPDSPLQIIKAEFGPDKSMINVTEKIIALVKNGKIDFCIEAAKLGYNTKSAGKKLKLSYTYKGQAGAITLGEGAFLQIPDPVPDLYIRNEYPLFREDLSSIDFDYYGMPHYTGSVFPEAQNAVYSDKFIPVKDVSVVLGAGLNKDDLRIALLTRKLEKWGAKTEISDKMTNKKTQILLNVAGYGKDAPDKPEGYTITCYEKAGLNIIAVNGKDKRGLLWGIVSVLQLTKHENGELAMRSSEITDYPDQTSRGVLSGFWNRGYEAMIFTKMNRLIVQDTAFWSAGWHWRIPGPPKLPHCRFADICYELGLDYYTKLHPAESSPKFIASNEKDFEQLIWLIKKYYASKHMNLYWAYDDIRFNCTGPFPPQDRAKFGSAANADSYAVQRLYTEVKKEYPDFKLGFCPPYYWTTGIYKSQYGESGTEYIKALARTLDPEIGIYWTGQAVGTYHFPKEAVAEIKNMMGRNPWIFKNRPGEHQGNRSLPSDERDWPKMSYDGFLNDINSLNLNTMGSKMISIDATLCDYEWNTAKYDAKRSTKNANEMIFGADLYAVIKDACNALAVFDNYAEGQSSGAVASASAHSVMDLPRIEEALVKLKTNYEKAKDMNPLLTDECTSIGELLPFCEMTVKGSKDPKILSSVAGYSVKDFALKETGCNLKQDLFIIAESLQGGFMKGFFPSGNEERFAKTIYGAGTKYSTLNARFTCDPYPPSGDYDLYISARVFSKSGDCKISVAVNNKIIYEGSSGFGKDQFAVRKILIPVSVLERYNTLSISNMENSKDMDAPCIAVSYIVMRKL